MSFIELVQNVQQKPRHIRQRIFFISITICMAGVIALWLIVASRRLGVDMFGTSNQETQIKTAASPLDMLNGAPHPRRTAAWPLGRVCKEF